MISLVYWIKYHLFIFHLITWIFLNEYEILQKNSTSNYLIVIEITLNNSYSQSNNRLQWIINEHSIYLRNVGWQPEKEILFPFVIWSPTDTNKGAVLSTKIDAGAIRENAPKAKRVESKNGVKAWWEPSGPTILPRGMFASTLAYFISVEFRAQ